MSKPQPLPKDRQEFDYHHFQTFKHNLPWWFRPTNEPIQKFAPIDFIADVRGRMERSMKRQDPEMARIFKDRRILAQSFSYRIARDTASIAKTGYGADTCKEFLSGTVDMMHRAQRMGIPQGDPLYGNYGMASKEHTTGRTIYLNDLTIPEKKLVAWLNTPEVFDAVFSDSELTKYMERSPGIRYVSYATDLRKKIWQTLGDAPVSEFQNEWRGDCVDLCIDEILKIRAARQQSDVDALVGDEMSGKILAMDTDDVVRDHITPVLHDKEKGMQALSVLEQLFVVAADQKDLERMQRLVGTWNAITEKHDIAPNERPSGGLAALMVKCAFENSEGVKHFLGPKPEDV